MQKKPSPTVYSLMSHLTNRESLFYLFVRVILKKIFHGHAFLQCRWRTNLVSRKVKSQNILSENISECGLSPRVGSSFIYCVLPRDMLGTGVLHAHKMHMGRRKKQDGGAYGTARRPGGTLLGCFKLVVTLCTLWHLIFISTCKKKKKPKKPPQTFLSSFWCNLLSSGIYLPGESNKLFIKSPAIWSIPLEWNDMLSQQTCQNFLDG